MAGIKDTLLLVFYDKSKGLKVRKKIHFYNKTLSWTRTQIEHYQISRLKKLLSHCQTNVPYYTDLFNKIDFKPELVNGLEDIKNIPVLSRDDIQHNLGRLINKNVSQKDLIKGGSSGTTGVPITYYNDKNGLSCGIAGPYSLWIYSGWSLSAKKVHIWGNIESVKNWNTIPSRIKQILFRTKNLASSELNDEANYQEIYDVINKFRPAYIEGYSSSIYNLASFIINKNLAKIGCKAVFTTAENLPSYQRDVIQKVFGPVIDYYGCGEINGIASQLMNSERYYIFEPHVYLETQDNGYEKELVITDLDNYGMPFIRYKVGDSVDGIYLPAESDPLQFRYFNKIEGRTSDFIELSNGKKILPINIVGGTFFRTFPGIIRHKVIWNGYCLHFLFELEKPLEPEKIKNALSELFRPYSIKIEVHIIDKLLPPANGKMKYFEIDKSFSAPDDRNLKTAFC